MESEEPRRAALIQLRAVEPSLEEHPALITAVALALEGDTLASALHREIVGKLSSAVKPFFPEKMAERLRSM